MSTAASTTAAAAANIHRTGAWYQAPAGAAGSGV